MPTLQNGRRYQARLTRLARTVSNCWFMLCCPKMLLTPATMHSWR